VKNRHEIIVEYRPHEAEVPVATVILYLGNEEEKNMKILKVSGIAKYPFITIDHPKLEFGDLLVGTSKEQKYLIRNPS